MLFLLEIRLKSLEAGGAAVGSPCLPSSELSEPWGLCRRGVDSTDNNGTAAAGVKFRCKDTTPVKAQQNLTTFYTSAKNDTISWVISGC